MSLFIRWVHVTAMAFVLGGAILIWWLARTDGLADLHGDGRGALFVAERYEWIFWMAMGLLVMTGVGNLGILSPALPAYQSNWGSKLTIKLFATLAFMLLSLLRTQLVLRLHRTGATASDAPNQALFRRAYAGTALFAAAILLLAVSLAHR